VDRLSQDAGIRTEAAGPVKGRISPQATAAEMVFACPRLKSAAASPANRPVVQVHLAKAARAKRPVPVVGFKQDPAQQALGGTDKVKRLEQGLPCSVINPQQRL
jgi:hypothetical protein